MKSLILTLENCQELSLLEIDEAASILLDLSASDELKERFLLALSGKGETPAEIAGFVEAFLKHAVDPHLDLLELEGPTLDVCGTGGDQLNLFNVSTTAMFVAAAAGAIVVKHGNRGITSKSGGADVLEALGIRIDLTPEGFRHCVKTAGLGFLFAPLYHPAFRAVATVRKNLAAAGHRSIFNLVGPLLNPTRPSCQLVGVTQISLCQTFAEILQRLGRKNAWVVCGKTADGRSVDEISLMGSTEICKAISNQNRISNKINPEEFGFKVANLEDLQGGDAQENAHILEAILSGVDTSAKRDIVLLNAAAAITCAGLSDDMKVGLEIARDTIVSGAALNRLRLLQKASQ